MSVFELSDAELLHDQMAHARFLQLLNQRGASVHAVRESTNAYGEFLFVTLSMRLPRVTPYGSRHPGRRVLTFWGLGYHESRERWLVDWRWHETSPLIKLPARAIPKADVLDTINARYANCVMPSTTSASPSSRAQAFSVLAEFVDEDGAIAELQNLDAVGVELEGLFDA